MLYPAELRRHIEFYGANQGTSTVAELPAYSRYPENVHIALKSNALPTPNYFNGNIRLCQDKPVKKSSTA